MTAARRKSLIAPDRLAALKARVPLPALIAESIPIQRAGRGEYLALCPFHTEQTPSFRIYSDHAHCFGCGWHGDQLQWLQDHARLGFVGALHRLCNWAGIDEPEGGDLELPARQVESAWHSIMPVPADAPPLLRPNGYTVRVFNPKRAGERWEYSSWRPAIVHAYRSAAGEVLGYVLRVVPQSGRKFTPTVTYCEDRSGERRWCIVPFARPLPLYGLNNLAARPDATVALVEGEKTADAAQRLLPATVATTWPGGSKSYRHVDFAPLRGRRVICIPDADAPGREAFCGRLDRYGKRIPGIVELLTGIADTVRIALPETVRPDGWDLADAEADGWNSAATTAWLRGRLTETRNAA